VARERPKTGQDPDVLRLAPVRTELGLADALALKRVRVTSGVWLRSLHRNAPERRSPAPIRRPESRSWRQVPGVGQVSSTSGVCENSPSPRPRKPIAGASHDRARSRPCRGAAALSLGPFVPAVDPHSASTQFFLPICLPPVAAPVSVRAPRGLHHYRE